jgi:hypothetical protein
MDPKTFDIILPQGYQIILVKEEVKCPIKICLSYLSLSLNILHSITACPTYQKIYIFGALGALSILENLVG